MQYALYSPYLNSFGGGEKYLATAAEIFAKKGRVVIFWDDPKILKQIEERFNLNLKKIEIQPNIFKENFFKRWLVLKSFDLVFTLSDGSIPTPFAKKNILHFQQPFILPGKTFKNKLKLKKYTVVCNSKFTKKYIDQSFGINSIVVYPPVDINFFKPEKKENVILSVGRFLPDGMGKKQEILIEAFRKVVRDKIQEFRNWSLYLAGSVGEKSYFNSLQKKAKNLPIKFFPNVDASTLKNLYGMSKIYWHVKGYGEDISKNPQFAEHFGIAIVEAQSAGCVPIVFKAGGVTEIIRDGVNGFFWTDLSELIEKTKKLSSNKNLLISFQKNSLTNAKKFSKEIFAKKFKNLIF